MEEILASIRRIISEDEVAAVSAATEPEVASDPAAAPAPVAVEPEEVLELTDPLPPVEIHGDFDVFSAQAARAPDPASYSPPPAAVVPEYGLISASAAGAAANAFGNFSAAISMPRDIRSLEDVTRELLRPLLKAWLDENLPRIVEAKVEEEVQRIARQRS